MTYFTLYCVLNLWSFLLYGYDKRLAIKHQYRIREKTLLFHGLLLPVGSLLGMILFHHKTRKPNFWLTAIIGLLLLVVGVYYYSR